jgi:histidinol-phosphate/aromatic aminotransferase/cobyric acid decarboxylase-like protein
VRVARDFPPFENTHCRISFGTMEEMKKAVQVFGEVLGKPAATTRSLTFVALHSCFST